MRRIYWGNLEAIVVLITMLIVDSVLHVNPAYVLAGYLLARIQTYD